MSSTLLLLALTSVAPAADSRQALQPFNDLIGTWRATGTPEGNREERQRGFWTESQAWEWQFKGADVWLALKSAGGKQFTHAELRPLPQPSRFRLIATTPNKQSLTFDGELKDQRLTLERTDETTKEMQRIVLRLLHSNRVIWHYETRAADKQAFRRVWQVGATKEGEPFAVGGNANPECIVSGGTGTIAVTHMGKTYYVCCSGCRDEFRANPEKYIKEFEAKKQKGDKP
jgi:hypothetical protein